VVRPPTSAPSSRPTTGPRPEREPAFARRVGAHRAHSAAWRRSKHRSCRDYSRLYNHLQRLSARRSGGDILPSRRYRHRGLRRPHVEVPQAEAVTPQEGGAAGYEGAGGDGSATGGERGPDTRDAGAPRTQGRRATAKFVVASPPPACGAPVPARASPAASTPLARRLPPLTAPFSGPYGGRQGREHRPQGTVGIGRLAAARGLALRLLCHPPVGRTPTDDAW